MVAAAWSQPTMRLRQPRPFLRPPRWRQRERQGFPMSAARGTGAVVLELDNISLSFGGVKALVEISFDVREHEIRAIIGPNGAGKSSMLNVINGVYRPQQGRITFRGETRSHMDLRHSAERGIARTFQSLALFK